MTCGLKRRVLLLLFVAAVLLSGCVSKGKYDELEVKYNGLRGQYNDLLGQYYNLQGQYKQLQQPSARQAAQRASIMAPATPFCFWTTQKHLTVERTMGPRT
jgi:outer membrane murein-binding lipoprotein Lpp